LIFHKSPILVVWRLFSHVFLSQLACRHIYRFFSGGQRDATLIFVSVTALVAVSNLILHSCFGFAEHFLLLLRKIGVVALFLFQHLKLKIFSLFLPTLGTDKRNAR
jgi:hypothetical protein